jgi:hypothetical protein
MVFKVDVGAIAPDSGIKFYFYSLSGSIGYTTCSGMKQANHATVFKGGTSLTNHIL